MANDIPYLLDCYRSAARRALDSGFDAIEIHAAHGYLLHSFLSPLSNGRQDRYGGDLQGRMRFPLEVAQAVRDVWPSSKPLLCRISSVDGVNTGWSLQDSIVFAEQLKLSGVDVIDCSSGGMNLESKDHLVPRQPGFQGPFAAEIRARANVATMAVGLIQDASQANDFVRCGQADLVALARELLWNPNWPLHCAQALEKDANFEQWPLQYGRWLARRGRVAENKVTTL
jgi:2,4-dienoyl-CoA reductase-like NADH-dependent reductase (Old Yellow Enzyme family)